MAIIKVSTTSRPSAVAEAIAGVVREQKLAEQYPYQEIYTQSLS